MKKLNIAFFTKESDFYDHWLDSMKIHAPALSRAHFLRVEKIEQLHLDEYDTIIFFLTEYEYGELVFDIELLIEANRLSKKGAHVFFVNRVSRDSSMSKEYRVSRISFKTLVIDQNDNHSVIPEVAYEYHHMNSRCRIVKKDYGNSDSCNMIDWRKLYKYIKLTVSK